MPCVPVSPAPRAPSSRGPAGAIALLGLLTLVACEAKFAQRLVAPELRAQPAFERTRTRPVVEIGPYVVEVLEQKVDATPARGASVQPGLGPARAGRLRAQIRRGGQRLDLDCASLRSVAADADLAAVADRPADLLELRCRVRGPQGVYALALSGRIDQNLRGEILGPSAHHAEASSAVAGPDPGGSSDTQVIAELELMFFYTVMGTPVRRDAPAPVAQAYIEDAPIAAMVLSKPERTWFDADTGPIARDVLFAFMIGARFVPGVVEI